MNEFVTVEGLYAGKGFTTGLIIGSVFMGFGGAFGYLIGYREAQTAFLAFGLLFSLIGLLIFMSSITGRIRRYRLRLMKPVVDLNRRGLLGSKNLSLHYDALEAVTVKRRGSLQVAGKHYELFNLRLLTKDGLTIRIGEKLSRRQAEKLAANLNQLLGLDNAE